MDASEKLQPDPFSEWVYKMDAAAKQVDLVSEEKAWKQQSIYRVNSLYRSHNPNAFTPQVISFGPFHHGEEHLSKNEVHKHRALMHFLCRAGKPLELFVSKLSYSLKLLQKSYQGLDEKWTKNPNEFLKMMLLDGCFMIEVLRMKESSDDYARNDPFFSPRMKPFHKPYIKRDMLLLENQLPLLVLKALLEAENLGTSDNNYIHSLVLKYCGDYIFESKFAKRVMKANLIRLASHPLELYRMTMLQKDTTVQVDTYPISETYYNYKVIENAVDLMEIGVRFRRSNSTSPRSIKFDHKAVWLELPVLPVHDGTAHILLNLIAYEQVHVDIAKEITSYIMFMDALINTADDVKVLQKKKIICNFLGSHEDIANLFNSLPKVVISDPYDTLNFVRYQLSEYYEKGGNKWLATLRHQYFQNPWKMLSVVAASFVVLFTFLQTIYSALSFHLHE